MDQGVYPLDRALTIARELALDLVEISPTADPPVCKVVDYSKFKYEQKKKQKELKAKAHKVTIKEIRFGPNTDEHDFDFKLNHAKNFLSEGSKVRSYVHFAGRSIVFKDRGEILLLKFAQALEEHAKVEQLPKLEGKRMFLMLAPKQAPVKKKKVAEADGKEEKKKKKSADAEGKEEKKKSTDAEGNEEEKKIKEQPETAEVSNDTAPKEAETAPTKETEDDK